MRASFFALALAVASLVAVPSARGQDQDRIRQAKEHYLTAEKAMEKEEYAIAAREYAVAYDLMRDPVLFYKIAFAREQAGDCEGALIYYGRYLKEAEPDESFRKQTRERIAACEKALGADPGDSGGDSGETAAGGETDTAAPGGDAGDTVVPGGDAGDTAVPGGDTSGGDTSGDGAAGTGATGGFDGMDGATFIDEGPTWQRTAGWVAVGATVAFATTGAVMGLSARSREENIERLINHRDQSGQPSTFEGNVRQSYEDNIEEGERFDKLAKISFGLAGAAAATAAIFFVLDATSDEPEADATARSIVPVVHDRGLGIAAGWEF